MKCILVVLLVGSATLFAQTFTTGQAARLVIGQSTFTSQDTNSSDTVLGGASGLAYAGDTLFVADSNRVGSSPINHRVLLFSNLSSQLPAPTDELNYNRKCPVCLGQASVVLGQPDFVTTTQNNAATSNSLRLPTAVASDGVHLVVADTDHNRVLIWNRIPANNNAPADVVVGQKDFVSAGLPGNLPNAQSMRGPQGVWIQNGKLYVADTQNNRVLIFNHIPTANGATADVVLGAPNFTTFVNPDITQQASAATATNMLNPVSVTSDGVRLFVSDLGFNRVLIFNTIPTSNGAAADVALGQPDLVSSIGNNAYSGTAASSSTDATNKQIPVLCKVSRGKDLYGNPIYPFSCNATLNFPRFALAAAGRLIIADGGNDRVLVFEKIPTTSGALADSIIGQIGGDVNQATDAADSLRTPMSLAWDGTNLYVSDAYNRRITVYTIGATTVGYQGVRNAAALDITARGSLTVSGTVQAGDVITITINTSVYTYTVKTADTLATIVQGIVATINSGDSGNGDQYVTATADPNPLVTVVLLTAKQSGDLGNNVSTAVSFAPPTGTTASKISVAASGTTLTGGGDAAKVAPGTVVSILGTNLSAGTVQWDGVQNPLPTTLGGTQVYFNGIRAPLFFVSPTQINAQVPWELGDTTSINAFVRSVMADGSIMFTSAVAVTIVPANPGLYSLGGTDIPPPAVVYHSSSNATAIVSVDGAASPGNVSTIGINGRTYSYTSSAVDSLDTIRDALILQLNNDPQVSASSAGVFDRIILKARVAGPEGNGIPITASTTGNVVLSALDSVTCCGNIAGAPVTKTNQALPGEVVILYATGLGLPVLTDDVQSLIQTGVKFPVPAPNTVPQRFVSATVGGSTADVLSATMLPGGVGLYQILLHLNAGLVSSLTTVATIAQDTFVSNRVTFPVVNPGATSSTQPSLSIVETHTGSFFSPGQTNATYTVRITNVGGGNPTSGKVTVTEFVPIGLTLVAMVGDGWTCSGVTCTRSDALAAGAAYPVITIIVNVASNADSAVINTVKIFGGGSASSSASDTTTIAASTVSNPPLLTVVSKHSGNFTKGQNNATYTLTVSNAKSASSTSGQVTVIDFVPNGLTLVSMAGTGWSCNGDTCARTDALGGGSSFPDITVTVNVASNAPASVANGAVVSGGGGPASVAAGDITIIN